MKKFKRTFIATLICAQAILPLPYAAARTIPGVDEPFNPPLYILLRLTMKTIRLLLP